MQCTGNSDCFSPGKRTAIVRRYPAFLIIFLPPLCSVLSCIHIAGCEAYSFTTYGYGIFNVRRNLGACRRLRTKGREEGGEGGRGVRHRQICTTADSERQTKNCPSNLHRQGIEPRVFGFGFRLCNQLSYVPISLKETSDTPDTANCTARHEPHLIDQWTTDRWRQLVARSSVVSPLPPPSTTPQGQGKD